MPTYFIADAHGAVKIGESIDPAHHLVELQTAHARGLTLLGMSWIDESDAQSLWASLRIRGEWFRLTRGLSKWIAEVSAPDAEPAVIHKVCQEDAARIVKLHAEILAKKYFRREEKSRKNKEKD